MSTAFRELVAGMSRRTLRWAESETKRSDEVSGAEDAGRAASEDVLLSCFFFKNFFRFLKVFVRTLPRPQFRLLVTSLLMQ